MGCPVLKVGGWVSPKVRQSPTFSCLFFLTAPLRKGFPNQNFQQWEFPPKLAALTPTFTYTHTYLHLYAHTYIHLYTHTYISFTLTPTYTSAPKPTHQYIHAYLNLHPRPPAPTLKHTFTFTFS